MLQKTSYQVSGDSEQENFFKLCKWSPDGTCILTSCEDGSMLIHRLQDESLQPSVVMREAERVHDVSWYPWMNSHGTLSLEHLSPMMNSDVVLGSRCFLSTSKDQPIHLWDVDSGKIRCNYAAMDYADQLTTCYCTSFSPDAGIIVAGSTKLLHVFDSSQPGRPMAVLPLSTSKRSRDGQKGPASALSFRQDDSRLLATGSFAGTIGLYDLRLPEDIARVLLLTGHTEGITQVTFSPDGWSLISAARKEDALTRWDLRSGSPALQYGPRKSMTNQRLYFTIDCQRETLLSGDHDGNLIEFDLAGSDVGDAVLREPIAVTSIANEAVSSVATSPHHPSLIAATTGQRHFAAMSDSDCEDTTPAEPSCNAHGSTLILFDRGHS